MAYAKSLEKPAGVDVSNKKFPETRVVEKKGLYRIPYQFSPRDDKQAGVVWAGTQPEDGQPPSFQHLPKGYGVPVPDLLGPPPRSTRTR